MPPAKSDVRHLYAKTGTPSLLDVKQACDECRKAKIRCLRDTAGGAEQADRCARCVRLHVPCNVRPHRKGGSRKSRVGMRSHKDDKSVKAISTPSESTPPTLSPLSPVYAPAYAQASETGPRVTTVRSSFLHQRTNDSTPAPQPNFALRRAPLRAAQDFSTSSLFHIGTRGENIKLRMSTMAWQLKQPQRRDDGLNSSDKNFLGAGVDAAEVTLPVIMTNGLFTEEELRFAHTFFFDRLNGCIALLTPSLNTFEQLVGRPNAHFLLTAICAISARFLWPERCHAAFDLTEQYVARFHAGHLAACLEHCQAFSILSMWRLPTDPAGWRKLHAAITIALEIDLPSIGGRSARPEENIVDVAQRQRTLFQLACAEEHFCVQRRIEALLEFSVMPDARAWIESLGDACLDVDIRIAAAMDQIGIYRTLQRDIRRINERAASPEAWSTSMQELRLLNKARSDQLYTADVWLDATKHGMPQAFAKRPCGLFNKLNHTFNYYQALMSIYARPVVQNRMPSREVASIFSMASDTACAMLEMLAGPLGEQEHYRYVHDNTTCSLAAVALWIMDHWCVMSPDEAVRARNALITAAKVTEASATRWHEQSAYLHRLLTHCCKALDDLSLVYKGTELPVDGSNTDGATMMASSAMDTLLDVALGDEQATFIDQDVYADMFSWLMSMFPSSGDAGFYKEPSTSIPESANEQMVAPPLHER